MHHANVWHISKRKNDNDYFYCRYFTFCLFSAKLNFAPISLSIPFDFWTEIIDKKGYNDWIEIIWLDSFFFSSSSLLSLILRSGSSFFLHYRSLPHSSFPSIAHTFSCCKRPTTCLQHPYHQQPRNMTTRKTIGYIVNMCEW